jgi:hypothetical protein
MNFSKEDVQSMQCSRKWFARVVTAQTIENLIYIHICFCNGIPEGISLRKKTVHPPSFFIFLENYFGFE